MMKWIYLDYNSTTPLESPVRQAMLPYLDERFVLPGNDHWTSRAVEEAIEDSRNHVATTVGALPSEITFTSGGTESINLAILGWAQSVAANLSARSRPQMILSAVEHTPVSHCANYLETQGWEIVRIPCDTKGTVDVEAIEKQIGRRTRLISIQLANQDIGTLQDITTIAQIRRPKSCMFHTDATQAMGKIPVSVALLGVDLLSISSHLMYGPKGVGALYIRNGVVIKNIHHGGYQELGLRPGTLNTMSIVGFGAAAQLVSAGGIEVGERAESLIAKFLHLMQNLLGEKLMVRGDRQSRLPNTINVVMPFGNSDEIIKRCPQLLIGSSVDHLDQSFSAYPRSALEAIQATPDEMKRTLRISVGWQTTDAEIEQAANMIADAVKQIKEES